VRVLRRHLGVSSIAVLSLALGIGATTAAFGWMKDVLLSPLSGVPSASRIVAVESVTPAGTFIDSSWPDYRDLRERSRAFDGLLAFNDRPLRLGPDDGSERAWALFVSGNYFDVLRVAPAAGRFFFPEEQQERPGGAPVAVISDRCGRGCSNALLTRSARQFGSTGTTSPSSASRHASFTERSPDWRSSCTCR
jgi:hypothetical protein